MRRSWPPRNAWLSQRGRGGNRNAAVGHVQLVAAMAMSSALGAHVTGAWQVRNICAASLTLQTTRLLLGPLRPCAAGRACASAGRRLWLRRRFLAAFEIAVESRERWPAHGGLERARAGGSARRAASLAREKVLAGDRHTVPAAQTPRVQSLASRSTSARVVVMSNTAWRARYGRTVLRPASQLQGWQQALNPYLHERLAAPPRDLLPSAGNLRLKGSTLSNPGSAAPSWMVVHLVLRRCGVLPRRLYRIPARVLQEAQLSNLQNIVNCRVFTATRCGMPTDYRSATPVDWTVRGSGFGRRIKARC